MCRSVRWSRAPVVTLPLSAEFQSQLISSHRLRSRSVSQRIAVAIAMDLLGDIVERDTGADSGDQDLQCSESCLLYTSPSPRDISGSRMPSSA